jgi:hypothetical protein
MKIDPRELAIFLLLAVGALGLGLLLNAGHFLWPMVAIAAGAYIVPTLYVKLRKSPTGREPGEANDTTSLFK